MDVETTFDALYSRLAIEWHQQDDIIDPFHDRQCIHIGAAWTFNFDCDFLRLDKKNSSLCIPLNLFAGVPSPYLISSLAIHPHSPNIFFNSISLRILQNGN